MPAEILIVIPTLGERADYLEQTLRSIRSQSTPADIVLVAPDSASHVTDLAARFECELLTDPGSQTLAINYGVTAARDHHQYVNWIGDDDILTPGSLERTFSVLSLNQQAVVAYGACEYIDRDGNELWVSRAGKWAPRILSWGPDLIPQPGMLVRLSAWNAVGGVDTSLRFAFDLDLLLKLRQQGTLLDVGEVVSQFRWHPESLTVSDRTSSLNESEDVKRRYLSPGARRFAWVWEKPVRGATRLAARGVTRRARSISR
jgi:glycosyltransferase involved in cell wall biosynthesis